MQWLYNSHWLWHGNIYVRHIILHIDVGLCLLQLKIEVRLDVEVRVHWNELRLLLLVDLNIVDSLRLLRHLYVVVYSSTILVIYVVVGLVVESLHGELVLLSVLICVIISTVPPAHLRVMVGWVVSLV